MLLTPGLRADYSPTYYLTIANDTDEPVTAVTVAGMSTIGYDFSYILYAAPMGYDFDMDGYGTMGMWEEYDCDDSDPLVHDGAFETPGDGIDQDCDGMDPPL